MTMKSRTLVYISVAEGAVFNSQVVSLLEAISKTNYFDRVVLFLGVKRNYPNKEELIQRLEQTGMEVQPFTVLPNYSFFDWAQYKILKTVFAPYATNDTVIHIRGEKFAFVVGKLMKRYKHLSCHLLSDIRGATIYEHVYYSSKKTMLVYKLKLQKLKKDLNDSVVYSDQISCVSERLKKYVIEESTHSSPPISINHCIANDAFVFSQEKRDEYRKKLSLKQGETLCVFVTGGNGPYQNTGYIVQQMLKKNIQVLNLSKSKIQGAINMFVPFSDVPGYLCAADIGIIWREDNVVNNVASPIKFSEYSCCGLPVVANTGVDLINDYIQHTQFGKTIHQFDELTQSAIADLLQLNRHEISQYARSLFGSDVVVDKYLKMYNHLLNKNSL